MNKKILIVDDNKDILQVLKLTFEMAGYTAFINKGDSVKASVLSIKPDAIILDVLLSGYDGRYICRDLKRNKHTSQIPVVMMSAHPKAGRNIIKYRADAFIEKPFDINNLVNVVNGCVTSSAS